MKILITGGAGFVGSNLAIQLKSRHPEASILAVDNLVRRGSELNLPLLKKANIEFRHADVRIAEDLNELPGADILIDASADPSVLAGIQSSSVRLVQNNFLGTINLLEYAKAHHSKVIFLSTSRVYPFDRLNEVVLEEGEKRFLLSEQQSLQGLSATGITENFSLTGIRSFYGAAKLSSELFINEYAALKGLQAVVLRCGVLAGPGQFGKVDQGVSVFWLASHFWKKRLAYFGYGGLGKQVRDILHIDDFVSLIDLQIKDFKRFENKTFNIGGGSSNSISLAELTILCQEITGNKIPIDSVIENRVADIPYYVSDNAQITSLSGWKPEKDLKILATDTFKWIKENENQLKNLLI